MVDQGFRMNPYIVARFFERLRKAKTGRLQKTRLQVATGLKWPIFARYLDRLLQIGMLGTEEESGESYIRITKKGQKFYCTMLKVLDELTQE